MSNNCESDDMDSMEGVGKKMRCLRKQVYFYLIALRGVDSHSTIPIHIL